MGSTDMPAPEECTEPDAQPDAQPDERADERADLSSLLEKLSERLHERGDRQRWYPGAEAFVDAGALPYYRLELPEAISMEELLEAALVRPAGVRFDFDDWLLAFERERMRAQWLEEERRLRWEREQRRMLARARREDLAVATHQRIAVAGGMACATTAVGVFMTVLATLSHPLRPNAFVAIAIALGGVVLMLSVGVAIRERRWNASP